MAEEDRLVGVQQFGQMFVVAMIIVAGVMVGYTIVRPKQGV